MSRSLIVRMTAGFVIASLVLTFHPSLSAGYANADPRPVLPARLEDSAFAANLGSGFNGAVYTISIGPQGSIIAGGDFTSVNGVSSPRLARLVYSGATGAWSVDKTFAANLGTGFNGSVYTTDVTPGGDIIVGGAFTRLGSYNVKYLARVSIAGVPDSGFLATIGTGFNDWVRAVLVNPVTAKITVGGDFTSFNGQNIYELTRLNDSGTLDTAFANKLGNGIYDGSDGGVMSLAEDNSGTIYAGGAIMATGCSVQGLVALNSDGSIKTSFMNNLGCHRSGFNNKVFDVELTIDSSTAYNPTYSRKDPNGLVVVGVFTTFSGTYVGRVARINLNGTFDTTFASKVGTGAGGQYGAQVEEAAVNPMNGDIVLGGSFSYFKGLANTNIVRLQPDGTPDQTFTDALRFGGFSRADGANPWVQALAFDDAASQSRSSDESTEHLIIGGQFDRVNGVAFPYLARIHREGDGDRDGLVDRAEKYLLNTDHFLFDTDGDGWDDFIEMSNGTDARNPDSDGDGIIDSIDRNPRPSDPNLVIDGPLPTIDGIMQVGQTLTVNTGTWQPSGVKLLIRWYIDDMDLPVEGANGQQMVIRPAMNGHAISVVVMGTKSGLASFGRRSEPTPIVGGGGIEAVTPVVKGILSVGQTLTCADGVWNPAPVILTHSWYRGNYPINGATGDSYTLTNDDLGQTIRCATNGTKQGYAALLRYSDPTGAITNAQLTPGKITVSGIAQVGKKLGVSLGSWSPANPTTASYQWYRGSTAIKGATKSSYTVASSDKGYQLRVKVTGKHSAYGSGTGTSSATHTVPGGSVKAATLSISGTVKVGKTVTAKVSGWKPDALTYHYQWLRNGKVIKKATKSSYTITSADFGQKLSVQVKATKADVKSGSKTSAAKKVGTGVFSHKPITISGSAKVGSTLHAQTGKWVPTPKFKVQWLVNGKAVPGATQATFKVRASDAGKKISVRVTATAEGVKTATATSKALTIK